MNRKTKVVSFEGKEWLLRTEFWKAQGFLTEEQIETLPHQEFSAIWPELSKSISCFLIEENESFQVLNHFQSLPSDIRLFRSCDAIVNVDGRWWVRNFWAVALKRALVKRVASLDTHSVAYLTGSHGYARTCLAVLSQMGFKKINWIIDNPAEIVEEREKFLRNFFGVELNLVPAEELTLQPNNGTVLINTLPPDNESILLQDLIYLNFLQKGGAAVDVRIEPLESQLLIEAESVGVHSVPGWFMEGTRDHLLLPNMTDQPVPEFEIYMKEWLEFLKSRLMSSHK